MATIFGKFLKWLQPAKKIHIDIDPNSVRENNLIRALANENAELKGERAKYIQETGKLRKSKKDEEEEEEIKKSLNEQKIELEKEDKKSYFSLKELFWKTYRDKKFREKLGYYTWNRSKKLSKFGDIGFSTDGMIVLLDDKRKIIATMRNLNDVFNSVAGLGNDINDGKIPINFREDGKYMENFMVWEANDITPTIDGDWMYSKARRKPFYEHLNNLRDEINDKNSYIETLEVTNTKLHKEMDDLGRAERVAEDMSQTAKQELSKIEQRSTALERIFRDTERELVQMREINTILEDNVDKLKYQLDTMRKEAEGEGVKLSIDKALETVQQIRRELVRDEPREKEIHVIEKQAPAMPQQIAKK